MSAFFGNASIAPNLVHARAPAAEANFTAFLRLSPTAQEAARAPAKASPVQVWSTSSTENAEMWSAPVLSMTMHQCFPMVMTAESAPLAIQSEPIIFAVLIFALDWSVMSAAS